MQSASQARAKWGEMNRPDQLLMTEHEFQLGQAINCAIEECASHVVYEIPWLLNGPWPVFNVEEVALELIHRARNKGYRVRMLKRAPPTIEVSGWVPHNKSRYSESHAAQHSAQHSAAQHSASAQRRPRKRATPEITLNDARRGVVSSRLRQRLERLNAK